MIRRPGFATGVTLLLAVAVGLVPAATAAAGAAPAQQTTSTTTAPEPPGIIPEPGSGQVPEDPGDRGGALQTALFALIVVALVGIGVAVARQSRKARRERGF